MITCENKGAMYISYVCVCVVGWEWHVNWNISLKDNEQVLIILEGTSNRAKVTHTVSLCDLGKIAPRINI